MNITDFYVNKPDKILHRFSTKKNYFDPTDILKVVIKTNEVILSFFKMSSETIGIDLLEVIDKKQMGQFIGSIFVQKVSDSIPYLIKTPSQTGHPDLIPSEYGAKNSKWDQGFYDQFPYGGVEVKTSIGSMKSGVTRTLPVGQPRIEHMSGVEWKGHHRKINNLLGLYWDYRQNVPFIIAGFFSNCLVPNDFTYSEQKPGGGNTTNVAITKSSAKLKMGKGWVFCLKNNEYKEFLEKKFTCEFV